MCHFLVAVAQFAFVGTLRKWKVVYREKLLGSTLLIRVT